MSPVARSLTLGLWLSAGLALAGPANNSLIIGASQEPVNILDPWRTNNLGIATEINGFMTARLVYLDNEGDLVPEIATRVPTQANGDYKLVKDAAGKVVRNSVTYTIRPDARWSDGTPITSRDFAFWLRMVSDERVPVPTRDPWDRARVTVTNSRPTRVGWSSPPQRRGAARWGGEWRRKATRHPAGRRAGGHSVSAPPHLGSARA